jgi:hypothetical protein
MHEHLNNWHTGLEGTDSIAMVLCSTLQAQNVQQVCVCPNFRHLYCHTGFGKYDLTLYLLYNIMTHSGMFGDSKVKNIVHVDTKFPSSFLSTQYILIHTDPQVWPGFLRNCIHLPWSTSLPWLGWGFCACQPTQDANPEASAWGVSYSGHQSGFNKKWPIPQPVSILHTFCNLIKCLPNLKWVRVLHSFLWQYVCLWRITAHNIWYLTENHSPMFAGVCFKGWQVPSSRTVSISLPSGG